MKYTENFLQHAVWDYFKRKNHGPIVPNVYFYDRESDVLSVAPSDFVHVVEIKVSHSDFLADFKKEDRHARLKHRDAGGPNYFWYATPPGVVTVSEIPRYAGLMYVGKDQQVRVVKPAPRLHTTKIDSNDLYALGRKLMFKLWNLWPQT